MVGRFREGLLYMYICMYLAVLPPHATTHTHPHPTNDASVNKNNRQATSRVEPGLLLCVCVCVSITLKIGSALSEFSSPTYVVAFALSGRSH